MKLFRRQLTYCCMVPIVLLAQSEATIKPANPGSLEQRIRTIEDREAILRILHEYVYTVDFGKETGQYTGLYTEDAVFQSIPPPPAGAVVPADLASRADKGNGAGAVVGRKALEQWIVNEWRVRDQMLATGHYRIHEMIAPDITLDGDRATSRSYFQTTDNDNGRIYVVSIGVYKDILTRSPDGRWRIKERLLIRQGAGAGAARPPAP